MKIDELSNEKRNRIIKALIDEYSTHGYTNASTNVIVEKAGISKGSLFNYIGNKEEQYLFIIDYVMQFFYKVLDEMMRGVELPEDYFEQILLRSKLKIRMALEYPKEYKLLLEAYKEPAEEIQSYMAEQYSIFSKEAISRGSEKLDASLLKNPEDKDKLVEIVFYLIAGYTDNYLKSFEDFAECNIAEILAQMTEELRGYFKVLKKAFFGGE